MLTVYDNFKEQQTKLMDLLTSDEYQTYEKAFEPSKSTSNGSKNSLYKEFKRLQSAVLLLNILVDATEGNRDNDSVDLRSAAIHALEFYQNSTRCQEKNIVLGGKVRFFCNKESKEDRQRVFKIIQSYFAELNLPKVVALIPYILLDNAIKYTPAKYYNNPDIKNDQNKQINFIFAQEDDGKMAMSISNVGPKYSDEQIAKLCEKDFRPEVAREHTSEGYGLGLYFVSRILRNCGASITFSSGDTIWTDNDIEYSKFCIKIKFDVNECEENVLQETTDFFLHEYNNILVNLNNSVTKIKTNINNNLEGICSVKNLDQDKLCDFLENLNEKARDYRLALLCYVFVYNPQFVKIDEETSNTKYNFDFLEELKKASMYYSTIFEEKNIKFRCVANNKEHKYNLLFSNVDDTNNGFSALINFMTKRNIPVIPEVKGISWLGYVPFLLYSLIAAIAESDQDVRIELTPNNRTLPVDLIIPMKGNDIMREDDESYNKSYPLIVTKFLMYILKGNNSKPRYKIDNTEYKLSFTL